MGEVPLHGHRVVLPMSQPIRDCVDILQMNNFAALCVAKGGGLLEKVEKTTLVFTAETELAWGGCRAAMLVGPTKASYVRMFLSTMRTTL